MIISYWAALRRDDARADPSLRGALETVAFLRATAYLVYPRLKPSMDTAWYSVTNPAVALRR